jgi:hypothetical protein
MDRFGRTVASRELLAGESVDEIAFLLGHSNANVTRAAYLREISDGRRRARRRSRMVREYGSALEAAVVPSAPAGSSRPGAPRTSVRFAHSPNRYADACGQLVTRNESTVTDGYDQPGGDPPLPPTGGDTPHGQGPGAPPPSDGGSPPAPDDGGRGNGLAIVGVVVLVIALVVIAVVLATKDDSKSAPTVTNQSLSIGHTTTTTVKPTVTTNQTTITTPTQTVTKPGKTTTVTTPTTPATTAAGATGKAATTGTSPASTP